MALRAVFSERIRVYNTPGGVALGSYAKDSRVIRALVVVESNPIRIQTNSGITVTPEGTEGSALKNAGAEFYVTGQPDLSNFRAISALPLYPGYIQVTYEGTA